MRRKAACLICITMLLFLTGCWDNHPASELSVATGMGIDKAEDGQIELTLQILGTTSGAHGSQSGSDTAEKSITINASARGITLIEAVDNLIPILGSEPFLSHVQLVAIGEDAAKDGLEKIWDYFERDHETGKSLHVLVVKNGTARSIMEAKPEIEHIGALELAQDSDNKYCGNNINIFAFEVTELLHEPLTGIVTGVIDPGNSTLLKEMKLEGGAVFQRGKLMGYLEKDEARGYLFAKNKINNTVLTVENPKEAAKLISIEVVNSSGKLSAKLKDGKPALGIHIMARGNLGDVQGGADITGKEDIKTLQSNAETVIEGNIRAMLEKTQKELVCDILNFNDILYKHDNKNFKKIKDNWETLFSQAEISIKVDFLIVKPGMIKKPAFNQ